jgi:lysophospholipase L1-like esterase
MRHKRKAAYAGAVATLALGSSMIAAPAFGATPTHYVALGDSYSSGVGTHDYIPDSGHCKRSPKAYPQLWVNSHRVAKFNFIACSGANTDDVDAKQLGALGPDTSLVTISVGGNDIGFTGVLGQCLLTDDASCASAVKAAETRIRDDLPAKLDTTYAKIRTAAPNAKVVVVGYPRLNTLGTCDIPGYSDAKRTSINAGVDALTNVIAGRASAAGFSFADARQRFDGHGVCGSQEWINGPSNPVQESFHPNVDGQADGYLPTVDAMTG